MKPKHIIVLLMFLLSISITACSSYKSGSNQNNISSTDSNNVSDASTTTNPTFNSMNTPSGNKIESIKTNVPSEDKVRTVSAEKILNILSTKNNDVIDSLNISDSDIVKSINGERFYVPVFQCDKLGILIGFNGANFDSIDKVKEKDETPIFIRPANGTIISFDKNISFRVGDDIKQFKTNFGEGKASIEGNLKADKQYSFLKYDISNLRISFRSINGDGFKEYNVDITRLQYNPTNRQIVSTNHESFNSLIPKGWHLVEAHGDSKVEGDLNADGIPDLALVIEESKMGESVPERLLLIAIGNKDKSYNLAMTADKAILRANEGGIMGEPFMGLSIDRGSLLISHYGGSAWRWGNTYRFRYQNDGWYLIGATEDWFNSVSNTGRKYEDINLLTGDYIKIETDDNGTEKKTEGNRGKKKLVNLLDFIINGERQF